MTRAENPVTSHLRTSTRWARGWVAISAAALALVGCGKDGAAAPQGGGRRGPAEFPVEVQTVEARAVQFQLTAVGSVEAFEQVQVTARVAGAVEKVAFTEGETVEKGHVLVEIEPSRYQLAVDAARAALRKAEATRTEAEAALKRRESVEEKNPGLIPGEQLEQFRTLMASATAEAAQARVALAQAELNLRDAYVRAPVAGVVQTRTVQTGQYIQPGAVLATMLRRDPLLLRFQIPEADAAQVKPGIVAKFRVRNVPGESEAKIVHVAGGADPQSRMVQVTAEIQGEAKETLRPGAFAEVTVPVGRAVHSPVVPQTSVRPSERGFLAYVVEDGVARERIVQLGMRTPDGLIEIRGGVLAGESLVIRGGDALRDGAKVRVTGRANGKAPEPVEAPASVRDPAPGQGGTGAGGPR